jgi:hypothetical protein
MSAALLAAVVAVGVNLGSAHSRDGLNDFNPGLYVVTASGYAGGVYHNSHRKASAWVARKWETEAVDVAGLRVSAAVLAGGVTGYSRITPLVSPSIGVAFGGTTARFSYAPKHPTKPGASDAIHFSMEFATGGAK